MIRVQWTLAWERTWVDRTWHALEKLVHMRNKVYGPKDTCMRMNLNRWDVACARKVGMKNKGCGPKDTCMRTNLGRRDVACARKIGMKNKVCGPEGCLHESEASTGRGMKNNFCGPKGPWYEVASAQLMLRPVAKPYFSSHVHSLCHVPLIHMQAWSNLIFHASVFWAQQTLFFIPRPVDASLSCKHPSGPQTLFFIPIFRAHATTQVRSHASVLRPTNLISHTNSSSACHVPSTQVHSHASVFWPINLISHMYQLFECMPCPIDPGSFSCKCLLAHKPYFSYVPTFRVHAMSHRPRFVPMQVSFGPQTLTGL